MTEQEGIVPKKKLRGPKGDIPGTVHLDDSAKQLVRDAIAAMSRRISGVAGLKIAPASVVLELIKIGAAQVVAQGQAPHAPSQTEG